MTQMKYQFAVTSARLGAASEDERIDFGCAGLSSQRCIVSRHMTLTAAQKAAKGKKGFEVVAL